MAYTSAATTEISKQGFDAEYLLELRPTGGSWATFDYEFDSLNIHKEEDDPLQANFNLIHVPVSSLPSTGDAGHLYERTSDYTLWHYNAGWIELPKGLIGCEVRVTSYLGSESEIEFLGEVVPIQASDYEFKVTAFCRIWRLVNALCRVTNAIAPKEVTVTGAGRRALTLLHNGQYGEVYGLDSSGIGDLGFDAATGATPRSWADQGLRIWKHATDTTFTNGDGNKETHELSHDHWREDLYSGAVAIIEADPLATYYADGLGAYEETKLGAESSTSGKNCDFARFFEQAISYDKARGGMGIVPGGEWGIAVDAASTGDKEITLAGDYTRWFAAGGRIYVQGSTGNDGTYSIASVTLSAGDTVIEVNETVPDGTADGYVTLDTGIDMPGIFTYPEARLGKLLERFRAEFQRNVKVDYDYTNGKYFLIVVEQKEAGSVDWALGSAVSIGQPRDGSLIKTGVQFTGRKARPLNVLEKADADGTLTDISTDDGGTAEWFGHNGGKVEGDSAFADLQERIFDGNASLGMNRHNLHSEADVDGSAGDKYVGWFLMFEWNINPDKPVERIEAIAPPSRNANHPHGHQGYYWPGLRADIYDPVLAEWFPISPLINGRYAPLSEVNVERDQIARPWGTKMRLLGGAYDHGKDDQTDPSVGITELRVYQDENYIVKASISPHHPIVARTTGAGGTFSIDGDFSDDWAVDDTFTVRDNSHAGTNTGWTVAGVSVAGSSPNFTTVLEVTGTIDASAGADGELYSTTDYAIGDGSTVQRHYPELWDRFGQIRWESRDLGDSYDESLAKKLAILELDDRLRNYQQVSFESHGPDPRIRVWDTVSVTDELNGDVTTLLVRSVTKTPAATVISGTNYRSGALGA